MFSISTMFRSFVEPFLRETQRPTNGRRAALAATSGVYMSIPDSLPMATMLIYQLGAKSEFYSMKQQVSHDGPQRIMALPTDGQKRSLAFDTSYNSALSPAKTRIL